MAQLVKAKRAENMMRVLSGRLVFLYKRWLVTGLYERGVFVLQDGDDGGCLPEDVELTQLGDSLWVQVTVIGRHPLLDAVEVHT